MSKVFKTCHEIRNSSFYQFLFYSLNGKINMLNHLVPQQTVHPDVIQMNATTFLTVPIHLQHYSRRSTVVSVSTFPPQDLPAEPTGPCIYFFPLEGNCMSSILSPLLCKWNLCYSRSFHLHTPLFLFC